MPPFIASLIYVGFVVWLFRRDIRQEPRMTRAFWVPVLWLILCSTRYLSQWLEVFGIHLGGASLEEGSPLDALFFFGLIVAGIVILRQRQVQLAEVIRNNRFLALFFAYCFLSILWSDYPFVAAKRLLKDLGHPIMVLVLLTEPNPDEAVIRLVKRCAYVVVPLSVLFIKYYPQWGRAYSAWTGAASYCGVTLGKNALGLDCFILGVFFCWYYLRVRRMEKGRQRRNEILLIVGFLALIGWLFHMAQSSTSLISLFIAIAVMAFLGFRWVNPRQVAVYLVTVAVIGVVAEGVFGAYTHFLEFLGKDPTLTDRTIIWSDLLGMHTNPLIGVGFESFWLGDRLKPLWAKWHWQPNEAHNGYLETYLDLGVLGLILMLGMFVLAYRRAVQDLIYKIDWGRFRMGLLVSVLFYNWTEVPFRATNPIWFYFFLIMMDYPLPPAATEESPATTTAPAEAPTGQIMTPPGLDIRPVPAARSFYEGHRGPLPAAKSIGQN